VYWVPVVYEACTSVPTRVHEEVPTVASFARISITVGYVVGFLVISAVAEVTVAVESTTRRLIVHTLLSGQVPKELSPAVSAALHEGVFEGHGKRTESAFAGVATTTPCNRRPIVKRQIERRLRRLIAVPYSGDKRVKPLRCSAERVHPGAQQVQPCIA
jgi:hypothetical protein